MTVAFIANAPPCIEPIVRVRRDGDLLRFVEPCPTCGRKHVHGVGDGGKNGWHGHRVAHCPRRDPCGYWLIEEGAALPREPTP